MSVGRLISTSPTRLGCAVSSTVTTGATVVPVDAFVVDFDEEGGQLQHGPTGDIYSYDSADKDAETITLTSALPVGRTLTAGEALFVYPRSDDFYADISVDDVAEDVVSARIPQALRALVQEGAQELGKGPRVRAEPGEEEWEVTELTGDQPEQDSGTFFAGDYKETARSVASGVLIDGGWLYADGTAVSRSTYARLFNAIGVQYGNGNGSTTFNLPDCRGRAKFGASTAFALAANDGAVQADRGPSHTHAVSTGGSHAHTINATNHNGTSNTSGGGALDRVQTIGGSVSGSHDHGGTALSSGAHDHGGVTGTGTGTPNPMGYITANVLIKT